MSGGGLILCTMVQVQLPVTASVSLGALIHLCIVPPCRYNVHWCESSCTGTNQCVLMWTSVYWYEPMSTEYINHCILIYELFCVIIYTIVYWCEPLWTYMYINRYEPIWTTLYWCESMGIAMNVVPLGWSCRPRQGLWATFSFYIMNFTYRLVRISSNLKF